MKKRILIPALVLLMLVVTVVTFANIHTVEVTGNSRYTSEEIEEMIFPDALSRNTLVRVVKNIFGNKLTIPFIQDYEVVITGLTSVEIICYEKSIVGYVSYMSSYMYFDKDGIVVESSNTSLAGIPCIEGLKYGKIVLYEVLPVEDTHIFDEILNLTQILSIYDLEVDRIRINKNLQSSLFMKDVEVVLGNNSEMNGKISELNDIWPNIEGLSGTLYLDEYQMDKENVMYTFKIKSNS